MLIMELCDTSLYNILELPENYFGLSEGEFKCVLQDVGKAGLFISYHCRLCPDYNLGAF